MFVFIFLFFLASHWSFSAKQYIFTQRWFTWMDITAGNNKRRKRKKTYELEEDRNVEEMHERTRFCCVLYIVNGVMKLNTKHCFHFILVFSKILFNFGMSVPFCKEMKQVKNIAREYRCTWIQMTRKKEKKNGKHDEAQTWVSSLLIVSHQKPVSSYNCTVLIFFLVARINAPRSKAMLFFTFADWPNHIALNHNKWGKNAKRSKRSKTEWFVKWPVCKAEFFFIFGCRCCCCCCCRFQSSVLK